MFFERYNKRSLGYTEKIMPGKYSRTIDPLSFHEQEICPRVCYIMPIAHLRGKNQDWWTF